MIALDSFVLRGNVNPVFPSLLIPSCKREVFPLSSKFPASIYDMQAGNLVEGNMHGKIISGERR